MTTHLRGTAPQDFNLSGIEFDRCQHREVRKADLDPREELYRQLGEWISSQKRHAEAAA